MLAHCRGIETLSQIKGERSRNIFEDVMDAVLFQLVVGAGDLRIDGINNLVEGVPASLLHRVHDFLLKYVHEIFDRSV